MVQPDAAGRRAAVVPGGRGPTVREVFRTFIAAMKGEMEEETRAWYRSFLRDFGARHPNLAAADVTEDVVRKWLSAERRRPWGRSTRRHAIANLKRSLNWAVDAKLIAANPIARMKRPSSVARERVLTPEERAYILSLFPEGDPFRDFLVAMQESGARPGEVMKVTAADVDLDAATWTVKGKDYNKTGKLRVIYLTPTLLEMTRRLMAAHPVGPLFRNADGNPWRRRAVNNRFNRKKNRKKAPRIDREIVAYTYRATRATDALVNEVPIKTVAELMGHRDTTMVSRHYARLAEKKDYLREAALRAVTGANPTPPPAPPALDVPAAPDGP